MTDSLTGDQVDALIDALCKAFWWKKPFFDFLRRSGVSTNDLDSAEAGTSKRDFLRWLFARYETGPNGQALIRRIAANLVAKSVFPNLEPAQIAEAKLAIKLVAELFSVQSPAAPRTPPPAPFDERPLGPPPINYAPLMVGFQAVYSKIGTTAGGREFETWFIELARAHSISARSKYSANGREFDGAISLDQATFLLELKCTNDKSDAPDISNFRDKVLGHAAGTLGLFVSINGFTQPAVDAASRAASPIFLADGAHLYRCLQGYRLDDLIRRLRRHSIETGQAYLPAAEL